MTRGRQATRSNKSNRVKKTESDITIVALETFITDQQLLHDPPEIVEKEILLSEYTQEIANFDSIIAENYKWLKALQQRCSEIADQNKIRPAKNPIQEALNMLNNFSTITIKTEIIENDEPMVAADVPQSIIQKKATPQTSNKKVNSTKETPKKQLLRESQIKPEVITPEAEAPPVCRSNFIEENPGTDKKESKIKKEKTTPIIPPVERVTRAAQKNKLARALPVIKDIESKKEVFEAKMKEVVRRKQEQDLLKGEKARQIREEKNRKVQENLEQQRRETEKKIEERRKREEAEEELRKMNAVLKSPARGRFIGSATNTPLRTGASPARLVMTRTPGLARAQLFPITPSRTPGRKPAKLPRVEQLASDIFNNHPIHNSPARQIVRKVASGNKTEVKKEEKYEKVIVPRIQEHNDEYFKNEQLKLLLESEEMKPSREELESEQEKLRIEEEMKRKVKLEEEEERKKVEEMVRKKEAAIKEEDERRKREEDRLKKEAARKEEEERNRQEREREEARLLEEIRRKDEEKRIKEEEEKQRIIEEQRLAEEEKKLTKQEQKPINKHLLNATQEMDIGSASESSTYEMTQEKIWIPATADNYNIEDLSSGDETDDEGAPRKTVPSWAQWSELYKTASKQYQDRERDYDDIFGSMENPHNQPIFNQSKTKKRPRGSSAHWSSPASNPTKGKSRFLGY